MTASTATSLMSASNQFKGDGSHLPVLTMQKQTIELLGLTFSIDCDEATLKAITPSLNRIGVTADEYTKAMVTLAGGAKCFPMEDRQSVQIWVDSYLDETFSGHTDDYNQIVFISELSNPVLVNTDKLTFLDANLKPSNNIVEALQDGFDWTFEHLCKEMQQSLINGVLPSEFKVEEDTECEATPVKKKGNRALRTLEALGIDLGLIPPHIKNKAYEISTGTGFSSTLEIGFLLGEDVDLIKELSEHVPALKVVTSKPELFKLRNNEGEEHVGFTHINGFYEDSVFYCVYALPAEYAFNKLKG